DGLARIADQNAPLETALEDLCGPRSRRAVARLQLHRPDEAEVADVDHVWAALEGVDGVGPGWREGGGAGEQPLLRIDLQGREPRGGGQRVAGIGVAME